MSEEEIPLHFTQEEVAILANCVGKTIAGTRSIPVNDQNLGHIGIEFTDGTSISLNNTLEMMPYDFFVDTDGHEEAGNFRLTDILNEKHAGSVTYDIPEDVLPVTRTIRRAYVVNETIVFAKEALGKKKSSFIHTQGIVFMFWDDTDPDIETPYYFYTHQVDWISDFTSCGITRNENECIKYNFDDWDNPDIYSVSMIRVG